MLVAAALIAVALVPMVAAYLQLGYHADVRAGGAAMSPGEDAGMVLGRAVHDATGSVDGEYAWVRRDAAVDAVNESLEPTLERVEASRVERGVVYRVSYNRTAARKWARTECPAGPKRAFGACESLGGVVVQERVGETHVLVVGLNVRATSEDRESQVTFVITALGRRAGA